MNDQIDSLVSVTAESTVVAFRYDHPPDPTPGIYFQKIWTNKDIQAG